jgi:signal transduction histidine kinase
MINGEAPTVAPFPTDQTLRRRLVRGFSILLGTMMLVVGLAIYLVELTFGWQRELRRVADGQEYIFADTSATNPAIVMLFQADGSVFYESDFAQREFDQSQTEMLIRIEAGAVNNHVFGEVDLGGVIGPVKYYVRQMSFPGAAVAAPASPDTTSLDTIPALRFGTPGSIRSVLVALSTTGRSQAPQRILTALFLMTPLIIAVSIFFGNLVVGQTLRPVDQITKEADAIRDGKSLHRRLAEPPGGAEDELARLTTTLNGMFARLETSFKSLRRFTADASHELKTPLTILKAGIENALTNPGTPVDVLEVLEENLVELNRMTDLVESLLILARADEGSAPLHLEEEDVRELLREVAETGSLLGEQADVMVTVDIPTEPLIARIDAARVRQMLLNLLANAVKYTPKGGRARMQVGVTPSDVIFNVKDTGIGIAPADLGHIFDRFWRIDPAANRNSGRPGTGLGLAITKWIAEAHGGEVVARSRPGGGSTFEVTLPLGRETKAENEQDPSTNERNADA